MPVGLARRRRRPGAAAPPLPRPMRGDGGGSPHGSEAKRAKPRPGYPADRARSCARSRHQRSDGGPAPRRRSRARAVACLRPGLRALESRLLGCSARERSDRGLVLVPTSHTHRSKWRQNDATAASRGQAMATTLRLPDELKAEAEAYARRLGLSMNGLLAVALRDYLDGRRPFQVPAAPVAPAERSQAEAASAGATLGKALRVPPGGPRSKCLCGSGQQWRHCHGQAQLEAERLQPPSVKQALRAGAHGQAAAAVPQPEPGRS